MTPRQRVLAARGAYLIVVLVATVSNLAFSWDRAAASARLARAFELSLGWRDAIDGLRNVTLFAGLGGVWVVSAITGRLRTEIVRATLVGLVVSATVEGLQCFSPVRTASVVDLATNAFGALTGAVAVALLITALRRAKGARSYLGVPAYLLGGAYALAGLCEALTPLFHSEPVSTIDGGPLARLRDMLRAAFPLSFSEVRWLDLALFAPAGFLAVMLLSERSRSSRHAWVGVAFLGGLLAVAAHVAHGMFGLPIRWEAAAADAFGIAFGAWAAYRWIAPLTQSLRGAARARAALAAYAGLLVLWGWRPLLLEMRGSAILAQFTAEHLVPLQALASRVDVFSAVHIAQQFFLYLPLGALLAVWPLRSAGRWSHLWPAVYLAIMIEAGHIVIAGRFLDDTNALVACAGLGIGWIVVRRSGFTPYGTVLPEGR